MELESPSGAAVTLTARALGRYEGLGTDAGRAGLILRHPFASPEIHSAPPLGAPHRALQWYFKIFVVNRDWG